jgi:hypothetical protein
MSAQTEVLGQLFFAKVLPCAVDPSDDFPAEVVSQSTGQRRFVEGRHMNYFLVV